MIYRPPPPGLSIDALIVIETVAFAVIALILAWADFLQ